MITSVGDYENRDSMMKMNGEASIGSSKNSSNSNDSYSWETRDKRVTGPRRTASATADISAWKISVPSEGEDASERSSDDRPNAPPPRILSFSVLTGALESTSRMKWYKNGFRKWKGGHQHDAAYSIPLQNHQVRIFACLNVFCLFIMVLMLFFLVYHSRNLMLSMKEVKVALVIAERRNVISSWMGGLELFKDNFKDPSIKFSMVGLFRLFFGRSLLSYLLVSSFKFLFIICVIMLLVASVPFQLYKVKEVILIV